MVPEGWQVQRLGAIASFRNGLNFLKDSGGEQVRVVGIPHFWQRQTMTSFDDIELSFVGRLSHDDYLRSGDLLFVRSNGNKDLIGRCMYFPKVETPLSFSGFTIRGRVNETVIKPQYASALMQTRIVKDQISRGGGGTNISNLSQAILSSIVVPLPPLPEQTKIVEILSTWDAAIETTGKLLASAVAQKQALMQQLLTGQRRYAEFQKDSWGQFTVEDVAECLDRKRVPLNEGERRAMPGLIPYWGANGIVDYVSDFIFDEPLVLLAEDGGYFDEYATRPIANLSLGKCWVNNHAHVLRARPNCKTEWLFFSLVHKDITAFTNSGTRSKLNQADMRKIPLWLPSLAEQEAIVETLAVAAKSVERLALKAQLLASERSALMQQLLTGKRRVTA
ncbi:restriction endonuclease subunit S [Mesorhizobium silamurunense]|uniref:restriction endonuclease subunit S n=1 Tax=Mesorhizobium silamurunense TaxID=499528 RepID=UPI0017847917|nr:restriction endonuclease subunit S [Mesorhizobium silamurunense]